MISFSHYLYRNDNVSGSTARNRGTPILRFFSKKPKALMSAFLHDVRFTPKADIAECDHQSALCQKDLSVLEIKFEFKFRARNLIGVAR
jgi:hypothetical protein